MHIYHILNFAFDIKLVTHTDMPTNIELTASFKELINSFSEFKTDFEKIVEVKLDTFKLELVKTIDERLSKLTSEINVTVETVKQELLDELNTVRRTCRDEIEKCNDKVTMQCTSLRVSINSLTEENNRLEQYTRKNSVRISGIPEKPGENVIDIVNQHVVGRLPNNAKFGAVDIDNCHRVGRRSEPGRSRQIIVKFNSHLKKMSVIRARSGLKGTGIAINDDLTKTNQKLLTDLRNHNNVSQAWSWEGRIFCRLAADGDNIRPRVIRSLHELFGECH